MKHLVKRVAAIHDLSGFGRASLSVIVPILSTMKVQVCALPTAVLSTHTGGFEGYNFIDLTDTMEPTIEHWKELGINFDCIYSGFLGSPKQVHIVSKCIDTFKREDNLVVVDPVMGDNGELYDTMDDEMVTNMRMLIKKADIITPNFTEVMYLLGEEAGREPDAKNIKEYLVRLAQMGPNIVIITSVPDKDKRTSVVAYDKKFNRFWKVSCEYIPAHYPGTGDSFTSVVIGSLLQGDSLPMALDRGVQFISSCIKASYGFDYKEREGVLLELVLENLKMPILMSSYELLE
ncbi:pyridoxamine kinase [Anaeromicrobium sediminis]|uniref:pyridoxal kinase n=1 Tax=Anaeromicrobium sediminis TaxID=1478221 RepID=A0A267ME25_9FIRM|nr:pyridoxamine kinase [Anaeromicrobium sediminis]PAB57050.1 pyridoxamine kinase [Anaeromicrobium sediminis]